MRRHIKHVDERDESRATDPTLTEWRIGNAKVQIAWQKVQWARAACMKYKGLL